VFHDVRTTLTLDDEVAKRLEEEMHRRGKSFKKTVILKLGLATASKENNTLRPYQVQPFDLGLKEGLSYDNIADLLKEIDAIVKHQPDKNLRNGRAVSGV
jgi:hypothetical protein